MSAFARVIIDRSIHRELDYSVPETMSGRVVVGSRVRVPFRDKSLLATVVATLGESPAEGIKPITALLGEKPVLSASLIELARWMANYYCCPIETVMRSLLPQVIRKAEVSWKKQLFVSPARHAPGRATRGHRATPRPGPRRRAVAPDFTRQFNSPRAR
jgi:primosomal protein N' (replication factor Y) (superfamily II helicase)